MQVWQVSRVGLIWLFVAVVTASAPLALHLPLWIIAVPLVGLVWRIGIYRGAWGAPGRGVRISLILASVAGLGFAFDRFYGLEPMASMLVCAFGLKLVEIRHRRDALVVIYLGFFVAAVFALFDQTLVAGGYMLFAFVVITASLAGIHQTERIRDTLRPAKTSLAILLQAIPLMVIFFLVMPRLGPFWSVPSPKTAVTGMRDHLAIGDITQLGKSSKTAFRVSFEGKVPPREELYWRGLTFSRFDGKTWKPLNWGFKGGVVQWYGNVANWWSEDLELAGPPVDYEVTLERQNGQWLFGLLGSETLTPDTGVTRMQTLVSMMPVTRRLQYKARSRPSVLFQKEGLTVTRKKIELSLPKNSNPQTQAMARQWAEETPDAEELISRVLDYYRQNFAYTLQPPELGVNAIDDFLFRSRKGFCEHFASSFVFLMRAAGIPARLVVGYQGGEIHPDEGYLTIRQYDAHAWAEVWLQGKGWTRVDPTSVVAPDRIAMGIISLMTAPVVLSDTTLTLDRYREISWMNQLRLYLDSLDYAWGRWVLGYQNLQSDFLQGLIGKVDFRRVILFVLLTSVIALLPAMIYSLWPRGRVKRNLLDRYYQDFCSTLARRGCARDKGETPRRYARRCIEKFPQQRESILAITEYYEISRYSSSSNEPETLKQLVRRFSV